MNWLESPFYPSKICWIVNFSFQSIKYGKIHIFGAILDLEAWLPSNKERMPCLRLRKKSFPVIKNGGSRRNGRRSSRTSINFFGLCEEKIRSEEGTHILPSVIFISSYFLKVLLELTLYFSLFYSGTPWPYGHGVSLNFCKMWHGFWRCSRILLIKNFSTFKTLIFLGVFSLDIVVDNCAICRNHIMDLCKLN